jgi:hypothetical protein
MMFSSVHGDVCLPSLIKIAEEIVDALLPISPPYSFGSALLAHTYMGLCDATRKKGVGGLGHTLVVPYEFLQLWSWEYIHIGHTCMKNKIHPYNSDTQYKYGPLTMASRWVHVQKTWATNIVRECYPECHNEFEHLEWYNVIWNPWPLNDFESIWGDQQPTIDCVRDHAYWMTRCNLLFIWMVEPYNLEHVMHQFLVCTGRSSALPIIC